MPSSNPPWSCVYGSVLCRFCSYGETRMERHAWRDTPMSTRETAWNSLCRSASPIRISVVLYLSVTLKEHTEHTQNTHSTQNTHVHAVHSQISHIFSEEASKEPWSMQVQTKTKGEHESNMIISFKLSKCCYYLREDSEQSQNSQKSQKSQNSQNSQNSQKERNKVGRVKHAW